MSFTGSTHLRFGFSRHRPPNWDRCLFTLKDGDFSDRKAGTLKSDVLDKMARCLPRETAADSDGFFAVTNLDELFDSREDMLRFYEQLVSDVFRRNFQALGCTSPQHQLETGDAYTSIKTVANSPQRFFHWDVPKDRQWPFLALLYTPAKNILRNGMALCDFRQFCEDRRTPEVAESNTRSNFTAMAADEREMLERDYAINLDWSPDQHFLVVFNNRLNQGIAHSHVPVPLLAPAEDCQRDLYRWNPVQLHAKK